MSSYLIALPSPIEPVRSRPEMMPVTSYNNGTVWHVYLSSEDTSADYAGSRLLGGWGEDGLAITAIDPDVAEYLQPAGNVEGEAPTSVAFNHFMGHAPERAITDTPAATEAPAITEAPMPTVESPPDEATVLTTPTDTADQVQAVTQCLLPDDKVYIRQQLEPIPKPHHMTVYREYCAVWHRAAAAEPNEIRRENVARRAANIWLREHAAGYLLAVLQQQDEFLEVAA